jgi:uncharacterized protein YggE
MKIIKITIAAGLVLAAAALAGIGRPEPAGGASEDTRPGITVTGTGEVRSVPDRADLAFSVHSDGPTAAAALAANSADLRRLTAALKSAGVEPSDLRTEHLGIAPRYDDGNVGANGYSADAYLTVSDQGLERAGRLIDVGVSAGADSVSGPALSLAGREAQYRQALKLAVDDAKAKAETLAPAAGVSLGRVRAVVEGAQYGGPVAAMEERALDAKTPIEPGTEVVAAVVTVTFAIS